MNPAGELPKEPDLEGLPPFSSFQEDSRPHEPTRGVRHLAKLFMCFIVFNPHIYIRILVISLSHFIAKKHEA